MIEGTNNRSRIILTSLLVIYFLLLTKMILFKESWQGILLYDFEHYKNNLLIAGFKRANFIPFDTLYYYLSGQEKWQTGLENLGGNTLLFIPYGFLLSMLMTRANGKMIILLVLLSSVFFETTQLLIAFGNCDIDDIILNTSGGGLGYLLFYFNKNSERNLFNG